MLRKSIQLLLTVYVILSLYAILRTILGLPFISWFVLVIPLIGFGVAILHAIYLLGGKSASILFITTFLITLFMETLSVKTGFPFGHYHYTNKLGPLFLGLVPYIIPLTWFMMAYPSFVMARRILSQTTASFRSMLSISTLGGLILTSWDLVMDPLMVRGDHWIWETKGLYFGIPLQNFFGWWLTAFLVYLIFLMIQNKILKNVQESKSDIDSYVVLLYGITGLGSLNNAWHVQYYGPFGFGLLTMATWIILAIKNIIPKKDRPRHSH